MGFLLIKINENCIRAFHHRIILVKKTPEYMIRAGFILFFKGIYEQRLEGLCKYKKNSCWAGVIRV